MSRAVAVIAFFLLLPQPAGAQAAFVAPAPDINAGVPGFLVALAVAYLAERRARKKS